MRSLWLQVAAVTIINLKSIAQRRWLSLSTVIAIALVVIVLLAFLAMANGFQRTIAGAGADDIAIVLRAGSQAEINSTVSRDQVRLIEDGPGIARGSDGKPLISPELYLVVDGIKRSTKTKANLPLRGIGEQGSALRKGITITSGRMFNRGSNEVVVGKALQRQFEGFDLGSTVSFGATRWTVVGVFDAGGSVFESEIWADLNVVQSLFNRNNVVQTVRARLTGPAALSELKSYSDNDPRLKLDVKSEAAYFAEQASQTSDLIQKLGWPLAIAMALGALAGALNTMYSSVAARATEIATLRAIGFGGFPAFVGTLAELLLLAAIGGLLGAAATYLIFDGVTASTLGGNFTQVVFDFKLSPWLIARGRGACADRGPDRRIVSGPARRAIADRRGPVRALRSLLFPLEACRADHLAPFARLVVDELAELGGRAGARFQSLDQQLLLHLGIGKHANNLRLQAIDDRLRRCRRRHEAVPAGRDHVGKPLLTQGGSLGVNRAALGRRHTQHAQRTALDVRQGGADRGQRGVETARQQFRVGHVVAAEGNDQAFDAGIPEQQLGGQMRLRACARRTKGQAFGLRLAVGDHLLNGLEGRLRVDHQEQRRHASAIATGCRSLRL